MFNSAPDTLFRLFASAYVPLTWCDHEAGPAQEVDAELQLAGAAAHSARSSLSPIGVGVLAALALIIVGAAGILGI
jgi:hypothetical protein